MSRIFSLGFALFYFFINFQQSICGENELVPLTIEEKKQQLRDLLYPNRHLEETDHGRMLFGQFLPNSAASCPNGPRRGVNTTAVTVPCVKCSNLDICNILNGFTVQEVYYPNNLDLRGTCTIIETLGRQMSLSLFGIGRTFRDTPQCREIVMQYLCLFWGSNNNMYTNCCFYQEDVTDTDPANHIVSPRPPCRSFCVQIAQVCANDETYLQLCLDIACPPTSVQCQPDPQVGGEVLNAEIGCDMPFVADPYAPRNGATKDLGIVGSFIALSTLIIITCLW